VSRPPHPAPDSPPAGGSQSAPPPAPTQLQYWSFYWPLVLTGISMLLAQQFQNGALARYPNAARELAVFALAASFFQVFNAALIFVPQMSNSFVRSRRGWRVCLRFTVWACVVLTLPLALMAFTTPGAWLASISMDIHGEELADVITYLRCLSPLVLVGGLRQFYTGMLIQGRRTTLVTWLNLIYLGVVIVSVLVGLYSGWRAIVTVAVGQIAGALIHLGLTYAAVRRHYVLPERAEHEALSYRETFSYFWGTALTSVMFSLSRPIIYSFLNRVPNATPIIASMRVGFDFAMIFHNALNQFRHLFVTFGEQDLPGVRRFMIRVSVVVVSGMVVVSATPVSRFVLQDLVGVEGEMLRMTRQIVLVMCLLPIVVNVRNYFHGLALIRRTTGRMGAGAVMRNVATYALAAGFFYAGCLDHITATLTLIAGFVAETLMVAAAPQMGRAARRSMARARGGAAAGPAS
jgi:progressive ankylosis protein